MANYSWTDPQRTLARLLFECFELTPDDYVKLFNHVARNVLEREDADNNMGYGRLNRVYKKKGPKWRAAYDLDKPNGEEVVGRQAYREKMMRICEDAKTELGITSVANTTNTAGADKEAHNNINTPASADDPTASHTSNSFDTGAFDSIIAANNGAKMAQLSQIVNNAQDEPAASDKMSSKQSATNDLSTEPRIVPLPSAPARKTRLQAKMSTANDSELAQPDTNTTTPATPTESASASGENSTPPFTSLEMVHYRGVTWPGNARLHKGFIDHDNYMYKLGGKIYRVLVGDKQEDIMICNDKYCAYCLSPSSHKTEWEEMGMGPVRASAYSAKSLPFVHASDCVVFNPAQHSGNFFMGCTKEYNEEYPENVFFPHVSFVDRDNNIKRMKVAMCMITKCLQCTPAAQLEKKEARYKPGGDLHKKK